MSQDELTKQVHSLFGDQQAYDGGYFSCYDGKWLDVTNEVVAVVELIERHTEQARIDERERIFLGVGYGTGLKSISMTHGPEGLMDFVVRRCAEVEKEHFDNARELARNTKEGN